MLFFYLLILIIVVRPLPGSVSAAPSKSSVPSAAGQTLTPAFRHHSIRTINGSTTIEKWIRPEATSKVGVGKPATKSPSTRQPVKSQPRVSKTWTTVKGKVKTTSANKTSSSARKTSKAAPIGQSNNISMKTAKKVVKSIGTTPMAKRMNKATSTTKEFYATTTVRLIALSTTKSTTKAVFEKKSGVTTKKTSKNSTKIAATTAVARKNATKATAKPTKAKILRTKAIPLGATALPMPNSFCLLDGQKLGEGKTMIYRSLFNVTCQERRIKVLNCVTSRGTPIALGTRNYVEDNFNYDCRLRIKNTVEENNEIVRKVDDAPKETESEGDFVVECDAGESAYVRAGFMVSCEREEILGCVDAYGDLVRSGHYVLSSGRLRECHLSANRRSVTSQWKGCFNGTRDDDPDLTNFHVPLGRTWNNDAFVLECGPNGFFVRKCRVETQQHKSIFIDAGSAWIDEENVFNVCQ